MAAGDLLTANYHHEVNGYLIGDDDPWSVDNVTGWVGSTVKSADTVLDLADGAVASTDTVAARLITLNLYCTLTNDDAVFSAIADLETAWTVGGDVELHAQLPHYGHVKVTGRCRDVTVADLRTVPHGRVEVQAVFFAANPTITEVA